MTDNLVAFLNRAGWGGAEQTSMAQDSSARQYRRLHRGGETAVLMIAPPEEKAAFEAFLTMADWLCQAALSSPQIYAADQAQGLMLIEDFGTGLMADLATADTALEQELYRATVDVLSHLARLAPPRGVPVLDAAALVQQTGLLFDEMPLSGANMAEGWQADLHRVLSERLQPASVVALRDLHAENVMWLPDRRGLARVGLLDFQDAVVAPPGYDLASLVDDPRREVPETLRSELISAHARAIGANDAELAHQVDLLSLARNLRILGIFRRAARLRDRPAYLEFLPRTAGLIQRAARAAPSFQRQIEWALASYGLAR